MPSWDCKSTSRACQMRLQNSDVLKSLVPGGYGCKFDSIIFKLIMQKIILDNRCEIALRWMPQNLTNEKSAWRRHMATQVWVNIDSCDGFLLQNGALWDIELVHCEMCATGLFIDPKTTQSPTFPRRLCLWWGLHRSWSTGGLRAIDFETSGNDRPFLDKGRGNWAHRMSIPWKWMFDYLTGVGKRSMLRNVYFLWFVRDIKWDCERIQSIISNIKLKWEQSQSGKPSPSMVTSSNGTIFRITGPLWWESTGHLWIPLTKASDAELSCVLWSAHEQTVEQTIETLAIWDGIALIMTPL